VALEPHLRGALFFRKGVEIMAEKKKKIEEKKEKVDGEVEEKRDEEITEDTPDAIEVAPRVYKDYDIKWLKYDAGVQHPHYYLVAEYEEKYGKVEE
jgi:hypothetical protein